ncbi:hypothetical protein V496_10265 [Pseudogymnoascus sp. VKM F-4515 (FW-2607)]|nr:hypothetical protein V496_10265 [Pseudogymnoascus sp. VKM F-4515 (FW-2607)]KFY70648.1 hypothetical protein V498_10286 [Pseudogymnoascus sp. VKM F-4517 (FW-2822)]
MQFNPAVCAVAAAVPSPASLSAPPDLAALMNSANQPSSPSAFGRNSASVTAKYGDEVQQPASAGAGVARTRWYSLDPAVCRS